MRYHLRDYKFDEGHIAQGYFIGRLRGRNIFNAYLLSTDIKSYIYIEINCDKECYFFDIEPLNPSMNMGQNPGVSKD